MGWGNDKNWVRKSNELQEIIIYCMHERFILCFTYKNISFDYWRTPVVGKVDDAIYPQDKSISSF